LLAAPVRCCDIARVHVDMTLILFSLVVIIVVARAAGWLFTRIGQPAVVGEIAAGVLLGPTLLGDSVSEWLFPVDQREFLALLANIGLVLFMFIVGLELDTGLVKGHGRVAGAVSVGSIVLPFALGIALAFVLVDAHGDSDRFWPFALFLGASMSVTAFPVLARILTDRTMHRTQTGGLALACAAVDDVLAWTLLAVVIGIAGGTEQSGLEAWLIVLAIPFAVLMLVAVRPRLGGLTRAHDRAGRLTPGLLAIVLVGMLAAAAVTELLHVHFIFGAFLFGAIMPREGAERLRHEILVRLEQISVVLLLPVFFLVSGLNVDLRGLGGEELLQLVLILVVAIVGKGVGAYAGARFNGVPGWQARSLGVLMNTRGLTELVILNVGREKGLIGDELFSMLVVMALVTTMMTGPLLRRTYPPERVARDIAEAERARLADQRLVALVVAAADEERTARRFDLALALLDQERPADVAISSLRPFRTTRLEVGSGLTDELVDLTTQMGAHQELVERGLRHDVRVEVLSRFSNDIGPDTVALAEAMAPEWVVVGRGDEACEPLVAGCRRRLVVVAAEHVVDAPVSGVVAAWDGTPDGDHAVLVAVGLAVARGLPVAVEPVDGASGRRARALVSALRDRSVDVVEPDAIESPVSRVAVLDGGPADLHVRGQEQAMRLDWATVPLPAVAGPRVDPEPA
jgi:Kef-type K+ transport system membrane component KefB